MAEPTTLNTTLAVAAVASLGPLVGEYALIVLGAFGGALLALQRVQDPMPRWWQPLTHIGGNVTAALLFTGVASSVVAAAARRLGHQHRHAVGSDRGGGGHVLARCGRSGAGAGSLVGGPQHRGQP